MEYISSAKSFSPPSICLAWWPKSYHGYWFQAARLGDRASGREINNTTFTIGRVIPLIPPDDSLIVEDINIACLDIGIDHYVGLVRHMLNWREFEQDVPPSLMF